MNHDEHQSRYSREDEENARLFGGGQSPAKKKRKKGMSDEEIIASGDGLENSSRVPRWFIAIIVVVLLAAYGLSLPFWGDRVDSPRPWYTWGHVAALAYIIVFGGFVYGMTMLYDPDNNTPEEDDDDTPSSETKS